MNETNLDHLLRAASPVSNWGSPAHLNGRDDQQAFDDHLAQATTPQGPVDHYRLDDSRPSASDPSKSSRPPENSPYRPEADKHADPSPPAATTETGAQENDRTGESADDNADTADSPTAQAQDPTCGGKPANGKAHRDKLADERDRKGNDEDGGALAAELAAASDATAAMQDVPVKTIRHEKSVPPTAGEESTKSKATAPQPASARQPVEESQTVKNAADPATLKLVVQSEALSTPAHAEQKAATEEHPSVNEKNSKTATRRSSEKPDAQAAQSTKNDRPGSVPKREHTSEHETASTGEQTENLRGDDAPKTDTTPRAERPAKKIEQSTDESRESVSQRSATVRQAAHSDAPNGGSSVAAAAAAVAATADTTSESSKPETSNDSVRPAAPHAPRAEAALHPLVRLQRGGTSAARGQSDAKSEELPRIDAARFVSRVTKAFHTAQERGGALQLRLSPPELGALRLELMVQDGVLAAKLETETPAVRRVLLDHLPVLRDRLAEQNIRIERFDVDVRQEGGGQSPFSPQEQRHQQPPNDSPNRQPSRQAVPTLETVAAATEITGLTGDTQINLVA